MNEHTIEPIWTDMVLRPPLPEVEDPADGRGTHLGHRVLHRGRVQQAAILLAASVATGLLVSGRAAVIAAFASVTALLFVTVRDLNEALRCSACGSGDVRTHFAGG